MKRSRKTKSRNSSPYRSVRKQKQSASLQGLITSQQQSIRTESQVSGYTHKTEKSNTFTPSQDFELVDDEVEKEEIREVFVSQEEEKVIQKILEVARKGKINQKNAFQIPLKVLDNDNFSVGKAKFWKFASELLGASMSIYEKRIENTWINTNLIHDKLARMAVNKGRPTQQSDQVDDAPQRNRSSEYLMLSIDEFRDPKILDNVRIGSQTLQTPQKINIPRIKQQFAEDPLFQRKIKAFDNTSLKGLLLNVFDVGSQCEIQLFCVENRMKTKDLGTMKRNQYEVPRLQKIVAMAIQGKGDDGDAVFGAVEMFRKNNTITKQDDEGDYDSIGFGVTEKKQNPIFSELEAFMQQPVQALDSQMPVFEDFPHTLDSKPDQQDKNTINSEFLQHSATVSQQPLSTMSQISPMFSDSPFSYGGDPDRSFHSVMTPWEMEFKEGKLRKKAKKREKKEGKKRERVEPGLVEFDAMKVENKKLTLNAKKVQFPRNSKTKQKNSSNLLPPQLAVYEKINYKRVIGSLKKSNPTLSNHPQLDQDLPDFLAPHPSMLDINEHAPNLVSDPQSPTHNPDPNLVPHEQDILLYSNRSQKPAPQRKYNIRETKRYIYERVKDEREIRISEVDLVDLSPAATLITFLHIANEKNMTVRNTSEEDDVVLSWQ